MSALITVTEYETVTYGEAQGDYKYENEYVTDDNVVAIGEFSKIVKDTMESFGNGKTISVRNSSGENWNTATMWIDANERYVVISLLLNI